jgi:polynucleotide 5'-kinase involved in rRNA processing
MKKRGPTILITGNNQSGKSTLCRIFANYSLRLGWRSILCDIDMSTNEISPPGCISAAAIDESLPNDDLVQSSLSFFHGTTNPDKTLEFFLRQV